VFRRHIKFRRRGITQKKTYNIQNTAKVWNQEYFTSMGRKLFGIVCWTSHIISAWYPVQISSCLRLSASLNTSCCPCHSSAGVNMYRAVCKMTPGHKHNSKEERGESVKCNHIRHKSNTILHGTKLKKKHKFRIWFYRIYTVSLQFKFFAISFLINKSNNEESAPKYSAIDFF